MPAELRTRSAIFSLRICVAPPRKTRSSSRTSRPTPATVLQSKASISAPESISPPRAVFINRTPGRQSEGFAVDHVTRGRSKRGVQCYHVRLTHQLFKARHSENRAVRRKSGASSYGEHAHAEAGSDSDDVKPNGPRHHPKSFARKSKPRSRSTEAPVRTARSESLRRRESASMRAKVCSATVFSHSSRH